MKMLWEAFWWLKKANFPPHFLQFLSCFNATAEAQFTPDTVAGDNFWVITLALRNTNSSELFSATLERFCKYREFQVPLDGRSILYYLPVSVCTNKHHARATGAIGAQLGIPKRRTHVSVQILNKVMSRDVSVNIWQSSKWTETLCTQVALKCMLCCWDYHGWSLDFKYKISY